MTDDWKGEHLIRGQRLTGEALRLYRCRVGYAQWNKRRLERGDPHPSAAAHSAFAKTVFRDSNRLREGV